MLKKNPGFTAVIVLVLALGIGTNTAIFSVVDAVLLRPLPFPEPEKLVQVKTHWIRDDSEGTISGPDYLDWAGQNTVFEHLSAVQFNRRFSLTSSGDPVALSGVGVSTDFFDTMCQGRMRLGRTFLPENSQRGKHRVVVLSHSLWHDLFGADTDIIGKEVLIDREPWIIIAVAKPMIGFFEDAAQIYVPILHERLKNGNRDNHFLNSFGRLKDGVPMVQAQAEMDVIGTNLAKQYSNTNRNKRIRVYPLHDILVRDIRPSLLVMYGAVGFVLLIVCVNVSSMLLAKATTRTKEMALRSALGAGRLRIIRQVLTESIILALCGGTLGLLLALWGIEALKLIAPYAQGNQIPGYERIGMNSTVLGFTGILSVLTAVCFGLVPAWHSSTLRLSETLKTGAHQLSTGRCQHNTLNTLVITQIALALVLLMGASLLIKSFHKLNDTHPGFDSSQVLTAHLELPHIPHYNNNLNRAVFYEQVIEHLAALPLVETVGGINMHPLTHFSANCGCQVDGLYVGLAEYRMVTTDYFKSLNIPLVQGRYFNPADDGVGKKVIIVNQEFVRRYFENKEPIGTQIHYHGTTKEIIGVVGNVKLETLRASHSEPFMYEPFRQDSWHRITILMRSTLDDPMALAGAVRSTIWDIDPDQPILRIESMNQIVRDSVSLERFCTILLSVMAGIALILAMVGIYGVMAFAVNERTNGIGIRLALGAQRSAIITLIGRKGLILTIVGLAIGLVGAFVLTRYMSSMLYEINATDPMTFMSIPLLLFCVAMLACYIPARRASKLDPMRTLRCE